MRDSLTLQIVHNFDGLTDVVSVYAVHILLGKLLFFYEIQKSKKVPALAKLSQQMQLFLISFYDDVVVV